MLTFFVMTLHLRMHRKSKVLKEIDLGAEIHDDRIGHFLLTSSWVRSSLSGLLCSR